MPEERRPVALDRDGTSEEQVSVVPLLTRHKVQVLLEAGNSQAEVGEFSKLSVRTERRIATEPAVEQVEEQLERQRRKIGRPGLAEPYRAFVTELLGKKPGLLSVEVLRRAKLAGYGAGKSALYGLVSEVRPRPLRVQMGFEGLPGEFSQHDFGEIQMTFLNGEHMRLLFFASRLKCSRWAAVTLVADQRAETLVRTLLDHFLLFGGVPLCAVFDRPRTVALAWGKDGVVTEWNPIFAFAAMEIGFTAEVCWPHAARQKRSEQNIVGWLKGSFFKQRRFEDMKDLQKQLGEWMVEINEHRPSRATGVIPAERLVEDRARLRAPRCAPEQLALRVPIQVGPAAEVFYDGRGHSMPPEASGLPGTLCLYRLCRARHRRYYSESRTITR